MSDNTFYIIVNKQDNNLTINENTNNTEFLTGDPNSIITGDKNGLFKVQVISGATNGNVVVNGINYNLVLNAPYTGTGTQIMNGATFAQASKAASPIATGTTANGAVIPDAANTNTDVDATGATPSMGGQKEKKNNHRNRNYSKKNRKSRTKSDTLRNYFNYNAIETI